jgi:hypothetical protein
MSGMKKQASEFLLLSIVSLLYSYCICSLAAIASLFIVLVIRRDLALLFDVSVGSLAAILLGAILFLPIRNLRKRLMEEKA